MAEHFLCTSLEPAQVDRVFPKSQHETLIKKKKKDQV